MKLKGRSLGGLVDEFFKVEEEVGDSIEKTSWSCFGVVLDTLFDNSKLL
jgi:hypothetical protein